MTRTSLALGLLCALLAAAAPAAAAPVEIGIGEQKASMFDSPLLAPLELRHARYIAPWDSLRSRGWAKTLPGKARFARAFRGFRERYPDVRDWIVWNEANHPRSLTATRPRYVARLFDEAARACVGCRIIGADVLDITGMTWWVRAFARQAVERPRIWGLHNYVDARGGGSAGTRALMAATRGKVWFTETGGWLLRRKYERRRIVQEFRSSPRAAARATRHVLRLACLSRRIRRVYLYNWQAPGAVTTWDSGFVGPRGRPRPAYEVLRRQVRRTGGPFVRCG